MFFWSVDSASSARRRGPANDQIPYHNSLSSHSHPDKQISWRRILLLIIAITVHNVPGVYWDCFFLCIVLNILYKIIFSFLCVGQLPLKLLLLFNCFMEIIFEKFKRNSFYLFCRGPCCWGGIWCHW